MVSDLGKTFSFEFWILEKKYTFLNNFIASTCSQFNSTVLNAAL